MSSPRLFLLPVSVVLFVLSGYCFEHYDIHHPQYVTEIHGATSGYNVFQLALFLWLAILAAVCLLLAVDSRSR